MLKTYLKWIVVTLLLTPFVSTAQLSGIYTIDSATVTGGTNYQTFTAAVSALTTSGVSGPVTFSVFNGTYSEQISIPSITGASATNTITFKGLGDNTTIVATPPTTKYPVVGFNAASHIVFDSIKVEVLGLRGWGFHFMNQSNNVTIKNCHIIAPVLTTCYGIFSSSSITGTTTNTANASYITVLNNHIEGGNNGISLKGRTPKTNYGTDFIISGNTLTSFRAQGVDLSNNNNVGILNNTISTTQATSNGAIRCWDAGDGLNIIGNKVYVSSNIANTRLIALSMAPANGVAGNSASPITVANNFIQYEGSNSTTPTGILLKNKSHVKVYHNTIKMKNQGTNANCIWFDANNTRALAGIEVVNNIMVLENSGSGQFFFSAANGAVFDNMVINHNNYYAPSNYFKSKLPNGTNGTITTYSTLASYKLNTYGYSTGALNVDPGFVSTTDLHVTSVAMNDSGIVISSITNDIDGDSRSMTTPDIGADEYSITPVCLGPTQTLVECDGFSITVGSNTYTTTGVYTDTLVGVGCDSIVVTDLTVNPIANFTQTLVECTGYSITVGSNTYSATGVYIDTLVAASSLGCDSIVTTDLTLGNYKTTNQVYSECIGFSITVGSNTYSTTGMYHDTLSGMATGGCDSIVNTDLTILNTSSSTDTQTVCDSLTWINGITYTSNNTTAKDTLLNAVGCDSVISLNLTITTSTASVDVHTECDSYTWIDGVTYTTSNSMATHTLTNAANCDSVVTLNLTINSSTFYTDVISACNSYTWIDGVTYTSSNNTAKDTVLNAAGCDSIISLDLTINSVYATTDVQTVCDNLTWIDGVTYTSDNFTATHTLTSVAGCDSVVTLNLTVNNTMNTTDVITACVSYTWIDGVTYTASNSTATDTLVTSTGCDSVITLNLTINSHTSGSDIQTSCDSLTWIDGITYYSNTSNAYHTIVNAAGCDSVVRLFLTIIPIDITTSSNWSSISANAVGMTYQWMDCSDNSLIAGETNITYTATVNGSYAVIISNSTGCVDTSDCVTLTNVGINEAELVGVSLYPNPTSDVLNIDKGSNESLEITITNNAGAVVYQSNTQNQITTINMSNMANGLYLVSLKNELGIKVEKIVKR
jgi:hypothetical protein